MPESYPSGLPSNSTVSYPINRSHRVNRTLSSVDRSFISGTIRATRATGHSLIWDFVQSAQQTDETDTARHEGRGKLRDDTED